MSWGFEIGRTYNRRADIHARFGGQEQGGIITPSKHQLITIITGEAGEAHGYGDRWRADGVLEYFGEGQRGDMTFVRGNAAILNHAAGGKDLLLFTKTKDGVRFEGSYVYEDHHFEPAPDTDGNIRQAIVFELRPLDAVIETVATPDTPEPGPGVDLATLRARAMAAATVQPERRAQTVSVFERSRTVRAYVFARAKGLCEDCGETAPFFTPAGAPFLEAHHIRRMTDGGPDDPRFMIALCPNCHRRAHYGRDAQVRNKEMLNFVTLKEGMQK